MQTIITLLSIMLLVLVATASTLIVGVYNLKTVSTTVNDTLSEATTTMAVARQHVATLGSGGNHLLQRVNPVVSHLNTYMQSSKNIILQGEASINKINAILQSLNTSNIESWCALDLIFACCTHVCQQVVFAPR